MKNLSFLIIALMVWISCTEMHQPMSPKEQHFQTLFKPDTNDGSCYRIPAIITASNGDLIVLSDQRRGSCADLKGGGDINIAMRRSEDNGVTWSDIELIVDYPLGQSASDPSLILDKTTQDIFMFFNYMDLKKEPGVYYLKCSKSSDNGKTWSEPIDITAQITKPNWHQDFKFITSGRGTQTKDGKLLHTLVNLQRGLFLFESDNHGETWHLIEVPVKPADESKVIELSDGRWMINSRVNGQGFRHVHISEDRGQTWTSYPDSSLADPSCNAEILRYDRADKNLLLFSNANTNTERKNLCIKHSLDEGETWSKGKVLYPKSVAYSSMTILSDGNIGVVFEKDDYQEIAFTTIGVEDL